MIAFILESSISLGALYACYYIFFSRDKRFIFNRFFLLGAIVFSLVVPFITLPALFQHSYFDDSHSQLIKGGIQIIKSVEKTSNGELNATGVQGNSYPYIFIYIIGVLIMAFRYLKNVLAVQRLIGQSKKYIADGVHLALVNQPVSPFCFGRYIIINKEAYKNGQIDEDIILHEKIHVRHGHTLDNLFIECILIFYWFNPLLWYYRTALHANHEFYADHIASSRSGIDAYCYKLINLSSGQYNPLPGSGFNFTLIKKRIIMMNRTKSPFFSFGRKLALTGVVLLITLTVFSFRSIPSMSVPESGNATFTVVIDPGHGGSDAGGHNVGKSLLEKDLVMDIANAIEAVDKDPAINFIYTRQDDRAPTLEERIQVAKDHQADLFLSLHINSHNNNAEAKGLEVSYSEKNPESQLSKSYSNLFASGIKLSQIPAAVKNANFIVLRKNVCPAVMLHLGFITNEQDAAFLSSKKSQQKLAEDIVAIVTKISKL